MSQRKSNGKKVFGFYWRHAARYPGLLTGEIIAVPLTALINGYLPTLILAGVLSRLSQHQYQDHRIWQSFGPELVAYFLLIMLGMTMWRVSDFFSAKLEARIQKDIANEVFNSLIQQSADFHANRFGGSLVSQTSKLLGSYVRIADTTVYQAYPLFAGLVFTSIILASRAPLFVLALLLFSAIFIGIAIVASKPVGIASARHSSAESDQTGYLADAISNNMAIKSYAGGDYERERFDAVTNHTKTELRKYIVQQQLQMVYLGTASRVISGASLTLAVVGVMVFKANIGTVFLILSYTGTIVDQLFGFSNNSLRNYNRSVGDAKEMVDILELKPSVQDVPSATPWQSTRGAIAFQNVGFTHDGASTAIFDGLNLQIKPGEKIGLVGHSGSGKTTFTRLLLRFSDIQHGSIAIDGQDIAAVTQDDLHRAIAYVPQEPLLFHRSIAENISYGNPEADQAQVEAAAKMASAHDFIETLPQGYDTLVGERGVKLSGGQRQRIAIARALLKNAPILALDEATSALDSESEVLIQAALWKLMEGRTAIVIAHRLSTIQKMDRIIVLDDGKIVEEGSHKELLSKKNGTYARLWAHQSGGFIEE